MMKRISRTGLIGCLFGGHAITLGAASLVVGTLFAGAALGQSAGDPAPAVQGTATPDTAAAQGQAAPSSPKAPATQAPAAQARTVPSAGSGSGTPAPGKTAPSAPSTGAQTKAGTPAAAALPASSGAVPAESAPEGAEGVGAPDDAAQTDEAAAGGLGAQLEELKSSESAAKDLRSRVRAATGEEKSLLIPQQEEADLRYWQALDAAAALLAQERPAEIEEADFARAKGEVSTQLLAEEKRIFEQFDANKKQIFALGTSIESATPEQRQSLWSERNGHLQRAPVLLGALDAHIAARKELGAQVKAATQGFDQRLKDSAHLVGAALRGVAEQLNQLKPGSEGLFSSEQAELQTNLQEQRGLLAELQKTQLALMDERGMDTSQHRQDLIRFTGEVSEDILNVAVAKGLATTLKDDALSWLSANAGSIAFKAASFLLILLAFALLARVARWLAHRAVRNARHISSLASEFFVKSMGRAVIVAGWVVAAAQIGVEVGPLLAGLGIAGFVLGFALQNTLSNFASGMMILVYRPFDVGDFIEAGGVMGTVSAMNLVSTAIVTPDNQMLLVPNTKIWGDVIRNVTHQPRRRVDLTFGIGYSDDIDHAQQVLEDVLVKNDKVLEEPAPVVRLHELGESSVNFVVRPWVNTADYWDVYWQITREVKRRFDIEGISIPFPQRDLHVYGVAPERLVRSSHMAPASAEAE